MTSRRSPSQGQVALQEIHGLETLRTQFNQDMGQTRLILFLSPTGVECITGARWVQTQLLEEYSSASLRVYAVWLPMMGSDTPERWDKTVMPDPRATHFWDDALLLAKWFPKKIDSWEGTAWDIYYLYGPDATWEEVPQPLVDSGGTIFATREKLRQQLRRIVEK